MDMYVNHLVSRGFHLQYVATGFGAPLEYALTLLPPVSNDTILMQRNDATLTMCYKSLETIKFIRDYTVRTKTEPFIVLDTNIISAVSQMEHRMDELLKWLDNMRRFNDELEEFRKFQAVCRFVQLPGNGGRIVSSYTAPKGWKSYVKEALASEESDTSV